MAQELTQLIAELTIAAEEVVRILDKSFRGEGREEEGSPINDLRKAIAKAKEYANPKD